MRAFNHNWASLLAGRQDRSSLQTSHTNACRTVNTQPCWNWAFSSSHPCWKSCPSLNQDENPLNSVSFSVALHCSASLAQALLRTSSSVCPPYLNGLGYVHFVYLNLGKAAPRHIFVLFIVTIKEVSGIYSNTNCSLRNDKWNECLALTNIQHT